MNKVGNTPVGHNYFKINNKILINKQLVET